MMPEEQAVKQPTKHQLGLGLFVTEECKQPDDDEREDERDVLVLVSRLDGPTAVAVCYHVVGGGIAIDVPCHAYNKVDLY